MVLENQRKGGVRIVFERFGFIGLAVLVSICSAVSSSVAQESQSSADETAALEADFNIQGEFVGHWRHIILGRTQFGLQVVALGDSKFSARLYFGGLPGAGAVLGVSETWKGEKGADGVVLWSGKRGMRVENAQGWIYDEAGALEGSFSRVERKSATLGLPPPQGATVLFDNAAHQLKDAKVEDGLLQAGAMTEFAVKDFRLHLEFRTPYTPAARDQGRGNSGVYIQRRYEVQILDSFGLEGKFNECGALYRQVAPQLNMALPPRAWQTYDIEFTAARFDLCGRKVCPAVITVFHNGVAVHYRHAIADKTGAGQQEGPEPMPILFQNHRDKVEFRNVWLTNGNWEAAKTRDDIRRAKAVR